MTSSVLARLQETWCLSSDWTSDYYCWTCTGSCKGKPCNSPSKCGWSNFAPPAPPLKEWPCTPSNFGRFRWWSCLSPARQGTAWYCLCNSSKLEQDRWFRSPTCKCHSGQKHCTCRRKRTALRRMEKASLFCWAGSSGMCNSLCFYTRSICS